MQFFFYAPLQPSSKPHAPLESRNGIKAGDLKTRDMIRISFNSPVCYTNCINISRNNLKWQFQGLYTHTQHKRKGEKKSQPLKGNKKLSLGASSSYPILLYTSCYPTLLCIRFTHCSCLSETWTQLNESQFKLNLRLLEKNRSEEWNEEHTKSFKIKKRKKFNP